MIKFTEYDHDKITSAFNEQCLQLEEGEEVTYSRKRKNRPEYFVLHVALIEGQLTNLLSGKPYELK